MDTAAGEAQVQAERVYERYYTLISTVTARILAPQVLQNLPRDPSLFHSTVPLSPSAFL